MSFEFIYWDKAKKEGEESQNIFVMFLSLMLLLLAFFILLTAISQVSREKYTQAVRSIETSFHMTDGLKMESFINSSNVGAEVGADPNLEGLADLFKTELPLMKVKTINDGRTLKVTLKLNELFDQSQKLNPTYYALFDRMIDLMNQDPYVLYAFVSRNPGDFNLGFDNVSFGQVETLDRYLNNIAMNKTQINLGIDFSGDKNIAFYLSKDES